MHDIKFRGKRIDNGEWVEGYYYKAKYCRTDDELCDYITVPHPKEYNEPSSHYIVDSKTVGQYTGLKDKNGTKIFEGDMINPFDDEIDKMVVEFRLGQFLLCLYGERGYMAEYGWEEEGNYGCFEAEPLSTYGDDIEVIGNIHDNPELLRGNNNG